jgi:hypothetical protein
MKPTVPLMMWGWIPLTWKLFCKLPHHRATIISLILAWMFLPEFAYRFPGLPDYSKMAAAAIAVLIATFAMASRRIEEFRWEWHDGVMVAWCLTPMFASVDNGLGLYDGVSAAKNYFTTWFAPYVVGRIYIKDWAAIRDLAWAIFIGGLIYAPLAAYEIVMSPQLHNKIYGWHPHDFIQSIRGNSYRPVIFMRHGLMVSMWMMAAGMMGLTLWRTGQLGDMMSLLQKLKMKNVQPRLLLLALLIVFVASKSMGATIMLLQGWIIIELCIRLKLGVLIVLLALHTPYSMYLKINGDDGGRKTVELIRKYNPDRAASLECRLNNEEMLVEKAMQRPVFGWGGWGRSRIRDIEGKDIVITDAYWVIVIGTTGLVGVALFCMVVLIPPIRFLGKFPKEGWKNRRALLAIPVLLQLPLYAADCMLNDMGNPIYMVIAGGLTSMSMVPGRLKLPNDLEDSGNNSSQTEDKCLYLSTRYI